MKKTRVFAFLIALCVGSLFIYADGVKMVKEFLTGYEEIPAVSTAAEGKFNARISKDETQIDYQLSYSGLEGDVQQAHIHLGQKGVNGGISVFLCTNLGNGPAGTQLCPPAPATITGTITAVDVSPNIAATAGARTQGLDSGEFGELLKAMRAGATYVNVHSTKWPGGEIRSQIDHDSGLHGGQQE